MLSDDTGPQAGVSEPRKQRKRRAFTQHRGVKILRRQRPCGPVYVARWKEPGTTRWRQKNLSRMGLTTHEARIAWAVRKSKELETTGPLSPRLTLTDAVIQYFTWLDTAPGRRRAGPIASKTRKQYGQAVGLPVESDDGCAPATKPGHFLAWAAGRNITRCDQLTPALLVDLHHHVATLKAKRPVRGQGAGQGAYERGTKPLAPASINQMLRAIQIFLTWLKKRELLPAELTSEVVRDRLELVRVDHKPPRCLQVDEIKALLSAAARHDAATHKRTRDEHRGRGLPGSTPKYAPILPFVRAALLSGCRWKELAELRWTEVNLHTGEIRLHGQRVKTRKARIIRLEETPSLWDDLRKLRLTTQGSDYVFGPLSRSVAEGARERLMKLYGAPAFTWHDLRRTCGTYLTCAPSIYGAASAYSSARRLGHSVAIAELHYLGQVKVPVDAETLEEAMGIHAPGTRAEARAQTLLRQQGA